MKEETPQQPIHPKIQEYITRINGGESKDAILKDLPEGMKKAVLENIEKKPSVNDVVKTEENPIDLIHPQYQGMSAEILEEMWNPPVYLNEEQNREIHDNRSRAIAALKKNEEVSISLSTNKSKDEERLTVLKSELGIEYNKAKDLGVDTKAMEVAKVIMENKASVAKSLGTARAMRELYLDWEKDKHRAKNLGGVLAQQFYNDMRMVDYPHDVNYEKVWEKANQDRTLPSKLNGVWLYRGVFKGEGQKTETRGSLNVNISEELLSELDGLIKNGTIKANYKFGQPGTSAAADARHDAISIYFIEQPSEDGLRQLAEIAKKHYRGDSLLGKKIGEGFSLSEVGSISDKVIPVFLDELKKINSDLGESMERYLTSNPAQGRRIGMSEAQYYAVQKVLSLYEMNLSFDQVSEILVLT
jgi:hypothetical protein